MRWKTKTPLISMGPPSSWPDETTRKTRDRLLLAVPCLDGALLANSFVVVSVLMQYSGADARMRPERVADGPTLSFVAAAPPLALFRAWPLPVTLLSSCWFGRGAQHSKVRALVVVRWRKSETGRLSGLQMARVLLVVPSPSKAHDGEGTSAIKSVKKLDPSPAGSAGSTTRFR